MNRIKPVTDAHPYVNSGAVRAMLVTKYEELRSTSSDLQADMDKAAEGLAAMTKDEILNFRAKIAERFDVPLSDFDDLYEETTP